MSPTTDFFFFLPKKPTRIKKIFHTTTIFTLRINQTDLRPTTIKQQIRSPQKNKILFHAYDKKVFVGHSKTKQQQQKMVE